MCIRDRIGRQAGFKSLPESAAHYRAAWEAFDRAPAAALPGWSDETLAWGVRAALKASDTLSWRLILRSVEHEILLPSAPGQQRAHG